MQNLKTNTEIDLNKYYNLTELLQFFTWVKTSRALARWIDADMLTENRLKATKKGSGTGTRYFIKGDKISNYLANMDEHGITLRTEKGGDNNG